MHTSETSWSVTWNGSLYSQKGAPGEEIPVGRAFRWGDAVWHIPSVYRFPEGLILDFCIEVDPAPVRAFIDKWDLLHEEQHNYTAAQRQQIEAEHPLHFDFSPELHLNGEIIPYRSASSQSWISAECLEIPIPYERDQQALLDHYGLDPARCWNFRRVKFPREALGDLSGLTLHLSAKPTDLPAGLLPDPLPGGTHKLLHPLTGKAYTLTVCETERQTIDTALFNAGMEYPTHYTAMTFTLDPDLPHEGFSLRDAEEGDAARRKDGKPGGAASVGIIGGASAPVLMIRQEQPYIHTSCSALRFDAGHPVQWEAVFYEKLLEDVEVELL